MTNQASSNSEKPLIVEMRGIVKRFPGVLANDHVNFELKRGEIHGLLGENGAGKSTLMNVLAGLYRQEAGTILVNGEPKVFSSPRDAINAGIGMVHQHFMLVPSQTVTENILLGLDDPRFFLRLPDWSYTGLHAASDEEIAVARTNGLSRHHRSFQARAADLINRGRTDRCRHAAKDRRLSSRCLSIARLHNIAHQHFFDIFRVDACTFHRGFDRDGAEAGCVHSAQCALKFSNGRARRA